MNRIQTELQDVRKAQTEIKETLGYTKGVINEARNFKAKVIPSKYQAVMYINGQRMVRDKRDNYRLKAEDLDPNKNLKR